MSTEPNNGWLECPECHTGYRAGRVGVAFDSSRQVTVHCSVCKTSFDVDILVTKTWEQTNRWYPVKEEVTTVTAEAKKRGA